MNRIVRNTIWALFVLLGQSSCSLNEKSILEVENLQGCLISMDAQAEGTNLHIITDNIWFLNSFSNKYNYEVAKQVADSIQVIRHSFYRGAGHGEYDNAVLALSSDKSLYVLNCSSNGNKIYSLARIKSEKYTKGIYVPDDFYDLSGLPALRYVVKNFVVQSDSSIIICGAPYKHIDHIFSVINFKKSTLRTLNYWPEDKHHGDNLAKHSVYADNSCLFHTGNSYMYLCGWERFAFIFTIDKNNVEVEKELFNDKLDYKEIADGNYAPLKISKQMLKMSATSHRIYALMIEKNINGEEPKSYMDSQYGNEIQIYDWEGNLTRHIVLDKVGCNLKVTDDDKYLYLLSQDPKTRQNKIWKYTL